MITIKIQIKGEDQDGRKVKLERASQRQIAMAIALMELTKKELITQIQKTAQGYSTEDLEE